MSNLSGRRSVSCDRYSNTHLHRGQRASCAVNFISVVVSVGKWRSLDARRNIQVSVSGDLLDTICALPQGFAVQYFQTFPSFFFRFSPHLNLGHVFFIRKEKFAPYPFLLDVHASLVGELYV